MATTNSKLTVGVDFGTSGVRALILDAATGEEYATDQAGFPRWEAGAFCDPGRDVYRQHPEELIDAFSATVSSAVAMLPPAHRKRIEAITIDTTGSSPTAVDKRGFPLALQPAYADNPDALVILWKDRSSLQEAAEITRAARNRENPDFLRFSGGIYSAEWFWAKILHSVRASDVVKSDAAGWLEHSDWMPAVLCGHSDLTTVIRNRCGAAHKAMWNTAWGGYPDEAFFATIDPYLAALRRSLPDRTHTADTSAGTLSGEWAARLGLPAGIPVGVGVFDAHAGAIGAGARRGVVAKVIGTSSSEMITTPSASLETAAIPGIESQAEGSIVPGYTGIEAGQPAFGDIFAWFAGLVETTAAAVGGGDVATGRIIEYLTSIAAERTPHADDPVALDWFNGRRAPFAASNARSAVAGLTLGTDAPAIFATLVRSVAFGTRRIHDHLRSHGVPIETIRAVGGIPRKSPYVMQTLADVLGSPIGVVTTEHAGARGAAILASVVSGAQPDTETAISHLASPVEREYQPDQRRRAAYDTQYARYCELARQQDPS